MQRNNTLDHSQKPADLARQIAFHEAGHAVAIYIRNRQLQLPPVFFQIVLHNHACTAKLGGYLAKVEGGRLIENLPYSLTYLSEDDKAAYLKAFEADMVNLLAGPLAEAKYIAMRDGEFITRHLVNFENMGAYGGESDLEIVEDYIRCFTDNMQQRSEKVDQLLVAAFKFIDNPLYWQIISDLADHIIQFATQVIPYAEITRVIENALAKPQIKTRISTPIRTS